LKHLILFYLFLFYLILSCNLLFSTGRKDQNLYLDSLTFQKEELFLKKDIKKLEEIQNLLPSEFLNEWKIFLETEKKKMVLYFDKITGKPSIIEGEGLYKFSDWENLKLEEVQGATIKFLNNYPKIFSISPSIIYLNYSGSGGIDYVYNLNYDIVYNGVKVEKAHLSFHLNHGAIVQIGQEYICDTIYDLDPKPNITPEDALNILWDYIGGKLEDDEIIESGRISAIPVLSKEALAGNYEIGKGLKYKLVYTIVFKRNGQVGTWEAKIDAKTGEILSFSDINFYGHIQGGVYKTDGKNRKEEKMPFPYCDYGNNLYSNILGNFSGTYGVSTMKGNHAKIYDFCGISSESSISLSSNQDGLIDFGTNEGKDCETPGYGGDGNTKAARTQYWNLTNMKIKASKYYPELFNLSLIIDTNYSKWCNAEQFWQYIKFYKSSTVSEEGNVRECGNSGEFPGIGFHEFGHFIDRNIGENTIPSEATADIFSFLETRNSCFVDDYFNENCGGYGDACLSCTGWRDVDYQKHSNNQPWNIGNYGNVWHCDPVQGQSQGGVCWYYKNGNYYYLENHCESGIATQAMWDLINRYLIDYIDLDSAWQLGERFFYGALLSLTSYYTCDFDNRLTNGCGEGSLYMTLKQVDDDDGRLDNGTPHARAIFKALNNHLIACGDENSPENQDYTICPPPYKPTLYGFSASGENKDKGQNILYWPSQNITTYVYRNEVSCNHGFARIGSTSGSCFQDLEVYPGITYYYRIQQRIFTPDCYSEVSDCIAIQARQQEGECGAPAPPNLASAEGLCEGIKLSWQPSGCGSSISYNIYRRQGDCRGSFQKIAGPVTGRNYTDTNVSVGVNYSYRITASCDSNGEVESPFSNCLTSQKPQKPDIPNPPTIEDLCNALKISWPQVESAEKYNVWRRDGGCGSSGWVKIASDLTETYYIDYNVLPGLTYGYYIEALNGSCSSADKNRCSLGTHAAPDISGIVKEIVYDKTKPSSPPTIRYVQWAKIKDLTGQISYEAITDQNGFYSFLDLQGSTYQLQAYKETNIDGQNYEIYYNPLPYKSVTVCKEDVPNQDFWKEVWVVPFRGRIEGPIYQGPILYVSDWTVSAYSNNYFANTLTDSEGYYTIFLPAGIYKVVARKDCYVSYPPYITQAVSDSPISNINFQITDWSVCNNCYPTFYREMDDCKLLINQEECINSAIIKFKKCAYLATSNSNSYLYNAVVLSVEVQRAKGSPKWESFEFQVQEEGDFFINITNGDYFHQETAVSSAEIEIEGIGQIFGAQDFNKNVFQLKKQIHLLPGNYTLKTIVKSQPGSYITIVISDKDIFSFPDLP
jgi:hypothetical protein